MNAPKSDKLWFDPFFPGVHAEWGHLPLRVLSQIAHTVRQVAGLRAEVF